MPHVFAVDIGGTFTDLVACDIETGNITYAKTPTTYGGLANGIFECIRKAAVPAANTSFIKHGTTLVINALLQRSGARTALLTTAGFRDVLEIGRGNRTRPFDLRFSRDPPLVSREGRFELNERMEASGCVRTPLSLDEIDVLAEQLKADNIEAIAISFINAYKNPAHEELAAERLRVRLPGIFVTTGTELTREWYECERTATAVANAFVGPQVTRYIRDLDDSLGAAGFDGALLLMGSHGGVLSTGRVQREPITLIESGPVGGCIGAATYADMLDVKNVISFDMGGTTAKCSLIENARYEIESTYHVGGTETGFPIRGNVIDVLEVGAGGGSIAWIGEQRRLHVGPRSAGSTPGPVCYGRGGTEPTVTDANLVLGRIDAAHFLGGEMPLDVAAARRAIGGRTADPLGYRGEAAVAQAARGILTIAAIKMAGAIKKISIARGRDPRDFALFSYGGGGPLHAAELARELHIPLVIVPPEPGNFSATGMLLADARLDSARTHLADFSEDAVRDIETIFRALQDESRLSLAKEFGDHPVTFSRQIEMRYKRQKHSLKVPIPEQASSRDIHDTFNREYLRRYGHSNPDARLELVAVHLTTILAMRQPDVRQLARGMNRPHRPECTRLVGFLEADAPVLARILDRYALPVAFSGHGPAIIEEYGSTTLVGPDDSFEIGKLGEIRIDCTG